MGQGEGAVSLWCSPASTVGPVFTVLQLYHHAAKSLSRLTQNLPNITGFTYPQLCKRSPPLQPYHACFSCFSSRPSTANSCKKWSSTARPLHFLTFSRFILNCLISPFQVNSTLHIHSLGRLKPPMLAMLSGSHPPGNPSKFSWRTPFKYAYRCLLEGPCFRIRSEFQDEPLFADVL